MKVADIKGFRKSLAVVSSAGRLGELAGSMGLKNIGAVVVSSGDQARGGVA